MPNSVIINGIQLVEPLVIEHHREPMLSDDGCDYLCTCNVLHVTGCYNPAGNTYAGPPAVAAPGKLPATTFAAIRHQLEQPQGSLIVTDGSNVVLKVQGPDVRNGPFVKVHDIVEQIGSTTYAVDLSIATFMNEVGFYVGQVSPVLSHRYSASDSYDEDSYLTRVITGSADFRADQLTQMGTTPDSYRGYFFHPCPAGFKPDSIVVNVDSDGLSLDYQMVFRQKPILVAIAGVSRIEAFDSMTISQANYESSAIGVAQGLASKSFGSIISASAHAQPVLNRQVHVRVWGYPNTSRTWLDQVACQFIGDRLGGIAGLVNTCTRTHDIMGRYVEVIMERVQGAYKATWDGWVSGLFGSTNEAAISQATFTQPIVPPLANGAANPKINDCAWDTTGIVADASAPANANRGGPYLPSDIYVNGQQVGVNGASSAQGCRGTYVGQLVMSALLGTAPPKQNVTPARPTLPPNIAKSLVPAGGK